MACYRLYGNGGTTSGQRATRPYLLEVRVGLGYTGLECAGRSWLYRPGMCDSTIVSEEPCNLYQAGLQSLEGRLPCSAIVLFDTPSWRGSLPRLRLHGPQFGSNTRYLILRTLSPAQHHSRYVLLSLYYLSTWRAALRKAIADWATKLLVRADGKGDEKGDERPQCTHKGSGEASL